MPSFQAMIEDLNMVLRKSMIAELDHGDFDYGKPLSAAARKSGAISDDPDAQQSRILDALPMAHRESIRATIRGNLDRDTPFGITLAWAPSVAYELTIWDEGPTYGSPGGITMLIKTPVPVPGSDAAEAAS
jgi:hypothetical protein